MVLRDQEQILLDALGVLRLLQDVNPPPSVLAVDIVKQVENHAREKSRVLTIFRSVLRNIKLGNGNLSDTDSTGGTISLASTSSSSSLARSSELIKDGCVDLDVCSTSSEDPSCSGVNSSPGSAQSKQHRAVPEVHRKPWYGLTEEDDSDSDYEIHPKVDDSQNTYESPGSFIEKTHQKQEDTRKKLLEEASRLHSIFNRYSLEEIFSYLEANVDNTNRMSIVAKVFHEKDHSDKILDSDSTGKAVEKIVVSDVGSSVGDVSTGATCKAHVGTVVTTAEERIDTVSLMHPSQDIKSRHAKNLEQIDLDYVNECIEILTGRNEKGGKEKLDSSSLEGCGKVPLAQSVTTEQGTSDANQKTQEPQQHTDGKYPKRRTEWHGEPSDRKIAKTETTNEDKNISLLAEMFPHLPNDFLKEVFQRKDLATVDEKAAFLLELQSNPVGVTDCDIEIVEVEPPVPVNRAVDLKNTEVNPPTENVQLTALLSIPEQFVQHLEEDGVQVVASTTQQEEAKMVEVVNKNYETFVSLFPDADPQFLMTNLTEIGNDETRLRNFASQLLENSNYPKRKEEKMVTEEVKKEGHQKSLDVESFVRDLNNNDPQKYYSKAKIPVREHYNSLINFLCNRYKKTSKGYISTAFKHNGYSLTNTCEQLDMIGGKVAVIQGRRPIYYVEPVSEELEREMFFLTNKDEIYKCIEIKRMEFEKARQTGGVAECGCCFDEVLLQDVSTCQQGHVFCKACIKRGAEVAIGDGKTSFACLRECTAEFDMKVIQELLNANVFSRLVQRRQLEEVKAAGIEDLECCPFCDFAMIPAEGDKVFHCQNPQCMRDSCRLCREASHIPLRCDENEKTDEVKKRTFIENRMTEALLRTCWKCQKKYIKVDGCNKMTCTCGAVMCYVCRQPVSNYSHFDNGEAARALPAEPWQKAPEKKCPLYSHNDELHVDAVRDEAERAKNEIEKEMPDVQLRQDPTLVLPERQGTNNQSGNFVHQMDGVNAYLLEIRRQREYLHQHRAVILAGMALRVNQDPLPVPYQPPQQQGPRAVRAILPALPIRAHVSVNVHNAPVRHAAVRRPAVAGGAGVHQHRLPTRAPHTDQQKGCQGKRR